MNPAIVGWAHSRFGRLPEHDLESLIVQVVREAVQDSGLEPGDIDAVFVGLFNNGFSAQDFPSSLPMQAFPELRFKPATRYENACATGSAAIHGALDFIRAGRGRTALVVGAEHMTHLTPIEAGQILLAASYRKEEGSHPDGFVGVFADIAARYSQRWGDASDTLARIAAKNHSNGVHNPFAQFRKDLGLEFCRNVSLGNPVVSGSLRRTDCSPVSDGAAALVITDELTSRSLYKAVAFRAAVQVNDFLPTSRRDLLQLEGAVHAWASALGQAGNTLEDLDLVETHDCFTIAELMEYEAMGLTKHGQGHIAIEEGWVYKEGRLPVNPSGGLKSKGHPIGATGVSMHVLAAMQVCMQAGEMQIPAAQLAGVFNMGGVGVANYVSILERTH